VCSTSPSSITTLNDQRPVISFFREGTNFEAFGQRATLYMSRYANTGGFHSNTRLDFDLATTDTSAGNTVLTLLSNGRVGIMNTAPSFALDVTTGTINASTYTGTNVGIGTTSPSFALQLSTDSAAKPSTNTWTISSDERLKTDITMANLQTCYDNIKSIPLKRYTWRNDVYSDIEVPDRSKLGWIAQDVETLFPKAVEQRDMFGYTDCRTLNSDQLLATLYGAVQFLMNKVEILEAQLLN